MFRRLLPLMAVLGVVLAGCTNTTAPQVGGKRRPKVYLSVVSLSPGATEILCLSGMGVELKGRTQSCNYPEAVKRVPVVAGVKPDYESLSMVKPDLVVYDKDLYSPADVTKIKALGVDTYEISATNLNDYFKQVAEIASMTGKETFTMDYTDRLYRAIQAAGGAAPSPRPKVALVIPSAAGAHMIAGSDSFQADEIRGSGGEPVGPKAPNFVTLNPEAFLGENPDYIVFAGKAADFLKDSRFSGLKAVKAGHIAEMNEDVALRRGARVDKFVNGLALVISGKANG